MVIKNEHHLPHHFDRYSPTDQARIANRMVAVLQVAQAGVDLEAVRSPLGHCYWKKH